MGILIYLQWILSMFGGGGYFFALPLVGLGLWFISVDTETFECLIFP